MESLISQTLKNRDYMCVTTAPLMGTLEALKGI